jgi:hypothetical protein
MFSPCHFVSSESKCFTQYTDPEVDYPVTFPGFNGNFHCRWRESAALVSHSVAHFEQYLYVHELLNLRRVLMSILLTG